MMQTLFGALDSISVNQLYGPAFSARQLYGMWRRHKSDPPPTDTDGLIVLPQCRHVNGKCAHNL